MSKIEKRFRQIQRKVRLNEKENELLKKKIQMSPYNNFQNYARHMLLKGEIKFYDFTELQKLNAQIRRIGVNINQIIHVANYRGKIMDSEMIEILSMQQELYDLVSKKIKSISVCDYFNMTNDFINSRYNFLRKSILIYF